MPEDEGDESRRKALVSHPSTANIPTSLASGDDGAVFVPFPNNLPDGPAERALVLQDTLISRSTGGAFNPGVYNLLRKEFIADPEAAPLLPRYVRRCRDLNAFWSEAKAMSDTYEGRRAQIRADFQPLLDHLEGAGRAPLDDAITDALAAFNAEGVSVVWRKALERRERDPEGAITAARTLLETVCKHVLDEAGEVYDDGADLPSLYKQAAKLLNLAPSAHTEEVFRQILGGCTSVVAGLGAVRNKISDAHGRGAAGVRPVARHAQLAVNLAGAMATFIVETWQARNQLSG
ncbi:abortive infection family protein [Phenylobacterium sp.]|uniref:abortive infection family protein n=1 Tax=Phenylobacterium sp. TaxID=1871053 RepID=UPI00273081A2|nr:abortive infection family protein [Phenylobacterium sp.]MDP1617911.1 abortive infection family protein [Phenylobacterium sp.]